MSKLTDDLKAAGWVETTLGDCRVGDEVVGVDKLSLRGSVGAFTAGLVRVDGAGFWFPGQPALRAPRPEQSPEVGEVWWCRHNESGEEASLISTDRDMHPWIGEIPTRGSYTWSTDEVTPLRRVAQPDGTPVLQDLPEWDPERSWPLGTVVDAEYSTPHYARAHWVCTDTESEPWRRVEAPGIWATSKEFRAVKVLYVPGHTAPSGPSLRERLLDEGTVEAVAEAAFPWIPSGARRILTIAADYLDPEVTR